MFKIASVSVQSYHTTIVDSNELAGIATDLTANYKIETAGDGSQVDTDSSSSSTSADKGGDNECVYINGLKLKIPPMIFDNDILSFSFSRRSSSNEPVFSIATVIPPVSLPSTSSSSSSSVGGGGGGGAAVPPQPPAAAADADAASGQSGQSPDDIIVISFRARDALFAWVKRHAHIETSADGSKTVHLPHGEFVEVPFAAEWNAARVKQESDQGGTDKALLTYNDIKLGAANKWDWTFTSDYCFSYWSADGRTGEVKSPHRIVTSSNIVGVVCSGSSSSSSRGVWRPERASGLDMTLLTDRAQPILFSDEMVLYQGK